jgi:hypothetical protein
VFLFFFNLNVNTRTNRHLSDGGAEQDIFVTNFRQDNQSIAKTVKAQNRDFPVLLEMGENVFSAPIREIWANYFVRKRQFKMTERIMDRLFKF